MKEVCSGRGNPTDYINKICRCENCRYASNSYKRAYHAKTRIVRNEQMRASYRKHRLKRIDDKLYAAYGITRAEKDEMLKIQNGQCAICFTAPKTSRSIHVDHDHVTGKIRGLLCHHCNSALGLIKENQNTLMSMINYLRKEQNREY